jgi:hypothetical protein
MALANAHSMRFGSWDEFFYFMFEVTHVGVPLCHCLDRSEVSLCSG